ncbi:MAG TPA: hypothetical protein VES20_23110, partial [Bryobacteraceae bacterium]|nr:hypothetical protein [Bryobacteraceae bacterium]
QQLTAIDANTLASEERPKKKAGGNPGACILRAGRRSGPHAAMLENRGEAHHTNMKSPARTLLQSIAATVLFAGIHSLLASNAAKRVAARVMGPGRRDFYRAAYNAQAIATSIGLYLWLRRLPDDELVYDFQRPVAYAMRAGQAVAAVQLARCIYAVGILNFLGSTSKGQSIEAQGPARRENGTLIIAGPFRTQRHPTNFWPVVLLWLQPRMTRAGLAFSVVASLYFYVGSIHQDRRLCRAYGEAYERYRAAGVPLFLPALSRASVSAPSNIPRDTK